MFGRRKKSDGFEWHRYVPTVIRHRREVRQQRVVEARQAAAEQMSAAGSALAAGSLAAGAAARDGARAGLGAAGLAAQTLWGLFLDFCLLLARLLAAVAHPIALALARPNIGGPVALLGAVALGAGIGRYRGIGIDREAVITLGIGIALLLATLPAVSTITGIHLPQVSARASRRRPGGSGPGRQRCLVRQRRQDRPCRHHRQHQPASSPRSGRSRCKAAPTC